MNASEVRGDTGDKETGPSEQTTCESLRVERFRKREGQINEVFRALRHLSCLRCLFIKHPRKHL